MQATLTSDEWRRLTALRDVPEGPLREELLALIDGLLEFVCDPGCAEMQADGVPCASAKAACDGCEKARAVLGRLRDGLHRS